MPLPWLIAGGLAAAAAAAVALSDDPKSELKKNAELNLNKFRGHLQEMEAFSVDLTKKTFDGDIQKKQDEFAQNICDDEALLKELREIFDKLVQKKQCKADDIDFNHIFNEMNDVIQRQRQVIRQQRQMIRQQSQAYFINILAGLKDSATDLRVKWVWKGQEPSVTKFENEKETLKAEITNGKEKLEKCRDKLNEETYQQEFHEIEQTYQGIDELYAQMSAEYNFFIMQTELCNQYEREIVPQLEELVIQAKTYVAVDEKDT